MFRITVAAAAAAAVDSVRQGKTVAGTAVDVLGTVMPPWLGVPEIERGMIAEEGRGALYWHHLDTLPEMRGPRVRTLLSICP